jgi:RNA polymerase sigma factor (sigma-70 family)
MMVRAAASPILRLIRRVVEDHKVSELPDQDLLQRFHAEQDQAAFNTLLRRHGPMVLDVCRAVLGNEADAEDAFQATFLVLAQKAGSIRKRASLGSWLYGAARRIALKARARSVVRHQREAHAPQRQALESDDLSWREVRQVLHEELSSLAERYREPLIMCYLEGATQQRAAARLGLAERTVRERLERGRKFLRLRLVRRGLGPAAVLAVAAWPAAAVPAAVPAVLMDSTVKAATSVAAGGAATSAVSAKVLALTQGALTTMLLTKLKATTVFVIAGLLVSGLLVATLSKSPQSALAQEPVREKKDKPADKGAPTKTPDRLKERATFKGHGTGVYAVAFSPDDKLLASASDDGSIKIWDTTSGKELKTLAAHQDMTVSLTFSPDGQSLASTSWNFRGADKRQPGAIRLWDVPTWEEKVQLKDNDGAFRRSAFSPDGKVLAASELRGGAGRPDQVKLWDTKTGKQLGILNEEEGHLIRTLVFSPDGKTLVLGIHSRAGDDPIRLWNWAEQRANGSLRMDGECRAICFTRDGKTLVTLNEQGEVTFWDFENARERKTVKAGTAPGWAGQPHGFALSADEKLVALGYAVENDGKYVGKVDLRDTASGELVTTLALDTVVQDVAFSASGRMLAAGCLKDAQRERNQTAVWLQGQEGIVKIWDLPDPKK